MDWTTIFSGWEAGMGTAAFAVIVRVALRQERHSVKIKSLENEVVELKTTSRKHSGNITVLMAREARA